MALLMLYDRDNVHADPEKDYRGCYKKGYVVETFEDTKPYVNPPCEPFLILQITDLTKAQVDHYMNQWVRAVDYTVIGRDVALDGWRLEIKSTNPNVSGKGHLTREMVENFINGWGGTVVNFVDNGVRFDISVYNAATSKQFWGRDVSPIQFTEVSYDQGTGVHRIEANYSGIAVPPNTSLADFERMFTHAVQGHGGTVISNSAPTIVFELNRDDIVQRFREDVRQAVQHTICRRQAYLDPSFADQIIANGRVMITTASVVAPYVRSRLDE